MNGLDEQFFSFCKTFASIEMEKRVRRKKQSRLHDEGDILCAKLWNTAVSNGFTPFVSGEGIKMFCVFLGLVFVGWSWFGFGCVACLLLTPDSLLGWQHLIVLHCANQTLQ